MYVVKAAEMTNVQKICKINVDEIDIWAIYLERPIDKIRQIQFVSNNEKVYVNPKLAITV
jgi:hypothetical protein